LGTFDGAYVEVIYNKPKTRIVKASVIPYENVRVGKYDEMGNIDTVYISPDWSRKYVKRNTPKAMATFNPDAIDTDSQVMILKKYNPNQPYYPVPAYMSAIQYILLEDDVAEYSRNSILNGFTPSTIFNFHNGDPDEDDKGSMEGYMKRKFTGKASTKFMLFFDNDKDNAVDITQLQVPDISAYYEAIIPIISDKIFTSHNIYPSIVGVPTSNGFTSNKDELTIQHQMYVKASIVPLQKLVISALKKVFRFNTGNAVDITFSNNLLDSDTADEKAEVNDKTQTQDAREEDVVE